jgi:adenylosuccinate synthase
VVFGGHKFALHHVPSGIFKGKLCVIGCGTVVDPEVLIKELDALDASGIDTSKFRICGRAHVVLPLHKAQDEVEESIKGGSSVGTTRRGIGPSYMDRSARIGIRVWDMFSEEDLKKKLRTLYKFKSTYLGPQFKDGSLPTEEETLRSLCSYANRLEPYLIDGVSYLNDLLKNGKSVLFEGAQGAMLDIAYGTYPYVTSSCCTVAGASAGTGVAIHYLNNVIGVAKAYATRVGAGPFPTEMDEDVGEKVRKVGNEFGTTTGRPRRVGWMDLVSLRTAVMINGASSIALMKADVLSCLDKVMVCTHYKWKGKTVRELPHDLSAVEPVYKTMASWSDIGSPRKFDDLPKELRSYIDLIESETGAKVTLVSYGPDREKTVVK